MDLDEKENNLNIDSENKIDIEFEDMISEFRINSNEKIHLK